MESIILECIRNIIPEIGREDAEVKAGQLARELDEKGLKGPQDLKHVCKEHLMPHFNEFQALRLIDEWKKPPTEVGESGEHNAKSLDIQWEMIWELDSLAKTDAGELKKALMVEKRRPSNSAELVLINYLVAKAKKAHPGSKRDIMESYVHYVVRKFPDSFNDVCGSTNLGYGRFMNHTKNQFDNRRTGKRKRLSGVGKENIVVDMPLKCVLGLNEDQWHDISLPEGESSESQVEKQDMLKKLSHIARKKQNASEVNALCKTTYPSQRRDILQMHKLIKDYQCKRKKKKTEDDTRLPEISDLVNQWPFLFRNQIILHVNQLYDIDLESSFSLFLSFAAKQLLEFLVVDQGVGGKIIENEIVKASQTSFDEPELLALLILLAQHFKEKIDCFIIQVEATTEIKNAGNLCGVATPCIMSCGPWFNADKFYLLMDQFCFYATKSFKEAFYMIFSCFFVFHIDFPKHFGLVMEYLQREALNINPERGTKRAEGSSSSPISIKLLDLTRKCQAYHAAVAKVTPANLSQDSSNSCNSSDKLSNLSVSSSAREES